MKYSFTLEQMKNTARERMEKTMEQLSSVESTLESRLGGRNRFTLMGAIVFSAVWVGAFLFAYNYIAGRMPEKYRLPLLGISLALMAFVVVGYVVQLRYYGTILNAQNQLRQLRSRVEMGQNALSGNLQAFQERQGAQWELALEPGPSINLEASRISSQLSGMEALSSGLIAKVKNVLFYVVCIAWAAAGSCALGAFAYDINPLELEGDAFRNMMFIVIGISCVLEFLVAKFAWSMTDCEVGNLTLLAVLAGPVVFAALILLIALALIVLRVVLEIAAVVIGCACVFGSLSG